MKSGHGHTLTSWTVGHGVIDPFDTHNDVTRLQKYQSCAYIRKTRVGHSQKHESMEAIDTTFKLNYKHFNEPLSFF